MGEIPSVPPVHWGTFTKAMRLGDTLSLASSVVDAQAGMQVTVRPSLGGPLVVGQSSGAIVFVTCASLSDRSTWVMVEAASTISSVAEHLRNSVREQIVRSVPID